MDPGLPRDVLTLVAGVATGVLSGAFGIGGAVLATPAIRALGVPALVAVGTTLPSILPGAVSGTARYAREGLVDLRAVAITAPSGVVASVAGSLLSHRVPGEGHVLMILTALLLAASAVRTMTAPPPPSATDGPPPPSASDTGGEAAPPGAPPVSVTAPPARPPVSGGSPPAERPAPRSLALVIMGAVAGLLSGLLGVGGGTILVPGLSLVTDLPLKAVIATSLACVGILAVPGTITHALLGDVDWRIALLLAVGVVPGARLGAVVVVRAGDRRLRHAVAACLGGLSIVYLVGETVALLNR